ncbi:transposase insF for insertion sequence IS3E [Escherichia coli KTE54]|nr:transposase insF for insertion sequence IS3E [Escherichia coli KTE54]
MKYVFTEKHQAEFSIKAMYRVLRVARRDWYTWCQQRTRISTRQQFRQRCDRVVREAFTRSKQRYGAPRLTDELRAQGYPFNVKTVAASLRRHRSGRETSRTYVQMKAGCIWQWSLSCGHVPVLAGRCRNA